MTVTPKSRLALAVLALSTFTLTACTASIPPGSEIADELIDTLEGLDEEQKECLHDRVAGFSVPVAAGSDWKNIDDVAAAADEGNEQAQTIIDDFFKKSVADCTA